MVANHSRKNDARRSRGPRQNHRQAVDAVRRTAPEAGPRIIVTPGAKVPRDSTGHPVRPIERGDVLRLSCPAGKATVDEVWPGNTVVVLWPWVEPDAERRPTFAVRLPETGGVEHIGPFHVSPPLTRDVRKGATFTVDMPPTVVHVEYTTDRWLAADRDAGRPPADSDALVAVRPYGVSERRDNDDARILIQPWSAEPMTVELLCRPYEAMPDGAEVVDADGVRWTYTKPLDWHTTARDTARTEGPAWPLTLTAQYTYEPDASAVEAVAAATATGSHDEELERWRKASGADLVEFEPLPEPEGLPADVLETIAERARRDVAGLSRDQVAEERETARLRYRWVSKTVLDDEDWQRVQAASARLDALDEVLEAMDDQARPEPAPDCCGHSTCTGDGPCGWVLVALLNESPRCDCRGHSQP